jgi:predicted RNA-binding protein with PUA-like domain
MKTEPHVFSFADLMARPGQFEPWDGVRNYQARNHMRAMQLDETVLIYHSSCEPPHVVGIATVAREAYPDATALDPESPYFDPGHKAVAPRWYRVDVRGVEALPSIVTLAQLRAEPALAELSVLRRGSRLSVTPVTVPELAAILHLAGVARPGRFLP